MSKVFVLGVDHFLQNIEALCTTAGGRESEAKQKESLRKSIESLIGVYDFQLITEEARLDRDCIGKAIADSQGRKYCNLTMPLDKRAEAGIRKNYDGAESTRRAAYAIFERFMFDQVQAQRGTASAILVICGSYHVKGVAELFRESRDDVVEEDTYNAEWYQGMPEEGSGGVVGHYKETHGRLDPK